MIFSLFVARCFRESWLTKITQMKLFYQKYLPMKISPVKVPLNCCIAVAKLVCIQCGKASKLVANKKVKS